MWVRRREKFALLLVDNYKPHKQIQFGSKPLPWCQSVFRKPDDRVEGSSRPVSTSVESESKWGCQTFCHKSRHFRWLFWLSQTFPTHTQTHIHHHSPLITLCKLYNLVEGAVYQTGNCRRIRSSFFLLTMTFLMFLDKAIGSLAPAWSCQIVLCCCSGRVRRKRERDLSHAWLLVILEKRKEEKKKTKLLYTYMPLKHLYIQV